MVRAATCTRVVGLVCALMFCSPLLAEHREARVRSISPSSGPPFTQVTVNGEGFGRHAGMVTFNGAPGSVVSWSDDQIVVVAPDGRRGSGPVRVNDRHGDDSDDRRGNDVVFSFTPTIRALHPSTAKPGWRVGVVGENFGHRPGRLTLNGNNVKTRRWEKHFIEFIVPAGASTGPVVVHTDVGASNPVTLTIEGGTTPLTITAAITPAPNAKGWNNTAVTVEFQCNGGTPPLQCPAAVPVTTEGANQSISGTVTDAAGAKASATATVNIDMTPPTISASVSPKPNANGWNDSLPVTVSFTCSDALSGVANCPATQTITSVEVGAVIVGAATDNAGNSASTSVTVNIETSLPAIHAGITPAPNASGWNNSAATVSFVCTPGAAPIVTCPAPQTISTPGKNQQVSGTVVDAAGNSSSTSVTVNLDETPPTITGSELLLPTPPDGIPRLSP